MLKRITILVLKRIIYSCVEEDYYSCVDGNGNAMERIFYFVVYPILLH